MPGPSLLVMNASCASILGVVSIKSAVCIDEVVCQTGILNRYAPTKSEDKRRAVIAVDFWCSLDIDRGRPIFWALGDGHATPSELNDLKTYLGLQRYRIPVATPSGVHHETITMDDAPDYTKNVLLPDFDYLESKGHAAAVSKLLRCDTVPFKQKNTTAIFRGSSTGLAPRTVEAIPQNTRLRASLVSRNVTGWDIAIVNTVQLGKPIAAAVEPLIAPRMSYCQMAQHKAVLDIDGNSNSWSGLFMKLHMKSLVIKVKSDYRQWYYHQLRRGRDYIPTDLSHDDLRLLPLMVQKTHTLLRDVNKIPLMQYSLVRSRVTKWWNEL